MSTAEIALEAQGLSSGDSKYLDCPFCDRKDKFSISRTPEGVLYHCFSASCGKSGFVPDNGSIPFGQGRNSRPRKRYIGEQKLVRSPEDRKFFRERFQIDLYSGATSNFWYDWTIYYTHRGEYIFPILGPDGLRVGEVIRQPTWEGAPGEVNPDRPKALTYIEPDALRLSWHVATKKALIVLVEDQISAERIRQNCGYTAVALLGNTISNEAVLRIAAENPVRLVWWLDEDMAETAFKYNAKYGMYFNDSRVVVTELDPKDIPLEDLKEVLFD